MNCIVFQMERNFPSYPHQEPYYPTENLSFQEKSGAKFPSLRCRTGELPYYCRLCGKRYRWKTSLHRHIRSHSTYHCTICSKNFDVWDDLVLHKEMKHSKKNSICLICGKGFCTTSRLHTHMLTHNS